MSFCGLVGDSGIGWSTSSSLGALTVGLIGSGGVNGGVKRMGVGVLGGMLLGRIAIGEGVWDEGGVSLKKSELFTEAGLEDPERDPERPLNKLDQLVVLLTSAVLNLSNFSFLVFVYLLFFYILNINN